MTAPHQRQRKRKDKDKIRESDITGLKYFDQLAPLLKRLHKDGCQRDRAGNRTLHYDQYCMLILLYLFNPIVTSLRGIQTRNGDRPGTGTDQERGQVQLLTIRAGWNLNWTRPRF